jgi:hypothetical protein
MKLALIISLFAILIAAQDLEPSIFSEWQNSPGSVFAGSACEHDSNTRFTGRLQPPLELQDYTENDQVRTCLLYFLDLNLGI